MATVKHRMVFRHQHIFVEIDQHLWVYDTGATTSFGMNPVSLLGSKIYIPQDYAGITPAALSRFIGEKVIGLIGSDLMNHLDHLIDLKTNTLTVSDGELTSEGWFQGLDFFMGVPMVQASVAGQFNKFFFDTGAPISYFQETIPAEAEPMGTLHDFFPTVGEFTTDTYSFKVQLHGMNPQIRFGKLPEPMGMSLGMADVSGILGNELLRQRVTGYFPRRCRLVLQA